MIRLKWFYLLNFICHSFFVVTIITIITKISLICFPSLNWLLALLFFHSRKNLKKEKLKTSSSKSILEKDEDEEEVEQWLKEMHSDETSTGSDSPSEIEPTVETTLEDVQMPKGAKMKFSEITSARKAS